jgi:hypothetical protein
MEWFVTAFLKASLAWLALASRIGHARARRRREPLGARCLSLRLPDLAHLGWAAGDAGRGGARA